MLEEICPENYQHEKIEICTENISNNLDKCINNIIAKTGLIEYDVEKKCVTANGGNYLGLLYEINVKGKTKEGDKELNLFVKSFIPGLEKVELIFVPRAYSNEVFIYKILSKMFDELQEEAQVPIEERYKMVKSYDETNSQMIVMENVAKKGFTTAHRMDVVSLEFAEKAIRMLAKFHALSFVIKAKRPKFFEEHIRNRKTPVKYVPDKLKVFVQSLIKITLGNIDHDDDVKARFDKFSKNFSATYTRYFFSNTNNLCLCHNDYRANNILTKVTDGEISEMIAVDYQMIDFGCPVRDITYFIVTSTDKEFRRAHLSHLRDLYHESLTSFLQYFDLDVNEFYPRNEFDKAYEAGLDYGIVTALFLLPFMFASEDNLPDLSKEDVLSASFRVDDRFKDRFQGVIDDFIEWGIL